MLDLVRFQAPVYRAKVDIKKEWKLCYRKVTHHANQSSHLIACWLAPPVLEMALRTRRSPEDLLTFCREYFLKIFGRTLQCLVYIKLNAMGRSFYSKTRLLVDTFAAGADRVAFFRWRWRHSWSYVFDFQASAWTICTPDMYMIWNWFWP